VRKMEGIQFEKNIDCINKWLVEYGSPKLQQQEEKFIIEDLQKIVDEYSSRMELDQLRKLVAIEAARMGCMIKLGTLSMDEMEIEIENLSKKVVDAKRKYLQMV